MYMSVKCTIVFNINCYRKFAQLTSSILVRKEVGAGNLEELSQHLPDFLWLLRDVTEQLPPKENGEPRTPTEYLRCEIFNENERGENVHSLLQLFPHLKGSVLVQPAVNPQMFPTKPENNLFFQGMAAIIENILKTMRPKKGFNGATVNGPILVALIREYEEAINDPDAIPDLEVTWSNVIKLHLSKVIDQLATKYSTEMEKYANERLPIEEGHLHHDSQSPDTLFGFHRMIYNGCLDHLNNEIRRLLLPAGSQQLASSQLNKTHEHICRDFSKRIVVCDDSDKLCGGELFHFVQKNNDRSAAKCKEIFESIYSSMLDCVSVEKLTKQYNKEAVGPAKGSVFNEELHCIPDPPFDACVVSSTPTQITLQWNLPKLHRESPLEYEIQMRTHNLPWKGEQYWADHSTQGVIKVQISDLSPNTEYSFRIRSRFRRRCGEYSDEYTSNTDACPPNTPSKPTVEIVSSHKAFITIEDFKPGDDNGSAIDQVVLESGFISDAAKRTQKYPSIAIPVKPKQFPLKHEITLKSHDERGEDYYQVLFRNKAGYSDPSAQTRVKTGDLIPHEPNDVEIIGYATSITFNWKPPDLHPHAVERYDVKLRKKGITEWEKNNKLLDTSWTVQSLQPVTEYCYEISAKNCHEKGGTFAGSVHTEAACPNQAKEPIVQVIDFQTVVVTVKKLCKEDENGSDVTHVKIEKSQDQNDWESFEFEVGSEKQLKKEIQFCTLKENNEVVTYLYFRVSMKNGKGWSKPSEEVQVQDTDLIPSAPTNVKLINAECGPRKIRLEWNNPCFHAHTVKEYSVYVNECLFVTPASFYAVPEVEPNTSYAIKIMSKNIHGKGEFSGEVLYTTPYAPPNPPSCECFKVDVISSIEAKLHIQMPQKQRGEKPITHILAEKWNNESWEHESEHQVSGSEGEMVQLTTTYSTYMRIRFKSDVGVSEPSIFVNIPSSSFIPGVPENLRVTNVTSTSITLCWEKPVVNAKAAKKYAIKKKEKDSWKVLYSVEELVNEVTELTPSTMFEVCVCAENDKAMGRFCQPLQVITLPKTPGVPVIRMINYKRAELLIPTVDLESGTRMSIETRDNASEDWVQCDIFTYNDTEADVDNPLVRSYKVNFFGMPRQWRMQLFNQNYKSDYSDVITLTDSQFVPGAPTELTVTETTSTTVTLTWKEPRDDQHPQSVAGYEIMVRELQGLSEYKRTFRCGNSYEQIIDNLRMATSYSFLVYAHNEVQHRGEGVHIEEETSCPIPEPPTNFRLAGATKFQIKVRWFRPRKDAEAVDRYEVSYRPSNGESSFQTFAMCESRKTSAVVTNLEAGTSYDFKICAVNKKGLRSEEVECLGLDTKWSTAKKNIVGTLAGISTFGFGYYVTHLLCKDDIDVKESP